MRIYIDSLHEKVINQFIQEGGMILTESYLECDASQEAIQALGNSIVYGLHRRDVKKAEKKFPEFAVILNAYLQREWLAFYNCAVILRISDENARWIWFQNNYPDLAPRLCVEDIASYLPINESLIIGHEGRKQ